MRGSRHLTGAPVTTRHPPPDFRSPSRPITPRSKHKPTSWFLGCNQRRPPHPPDGQAQHRGASPHTGLGTTQRSPRPYGNPAHNQAVLLCKALPSTRQHRGIPVLGFLCHRIPGWNQQQGTAPLSAKKTTTGSTRSVRRSPGEKIRKSKGSSKVEHPTSVQSASPYTVGSIFFQFSQPRQASTLGLLSRAAALLPQAGSPRWQFLLAHCSSRSVLVPSRDPRHGFTALIFILHVSLFLPLAQ